MSLDPTDIRRAVLRYADRFSAAGGHAHHVASPLGAWLVLALAGTSAEGDLADQMTDALGVDADAAGDAARRLLDRPPAAVAALATKVTWLEPFETCAAKALRSSWSAQVGTVLRSPSGYAHRVRIVDSQRAGRVGVHTAMADGLEVTSVVAAENVSAADVLAAAHDIATRPGRQAVSLFDLPLGDQPLWTITERRSDDEGERMEAVLPAWSASSKHDLMQHPDLGFESAGKALARRAQIGQPMLEAVQSAIASYSRDGFEAAAVTALAVAVSARMPRPGCFREATVRFGHPYAVVATVTDSKPDSVWDGLPVFSAWVSEPEDAGR